GRRPKCAKTRALPRAIGKTGTLVHSYGAVDSFAYQRAILRMLAHDDKTPLINMDVQLYGLLPQ
ncbi:hypothetical protein, partial [Bifidobacterium longum]|uniref:hypothetical protein n=1 Tax=Bifidobacterium longum TaxID=216816 RepID=UPI001A955FCE